MILTLGSGRPRFSPAMAKIRWLPLLISTVVACGLNGCQERGENSASASEATPTISGGSHSEPTSPQSGFPIHLTDASGSSLTLLKVPARIVSLVPSATRTLQALGAQQLLVGRTEYDTDNSLARLPSVGGGLEPSLETLILLEPELVIRFAGESDPSTPRRLEEAGIPQFAVRPDRIADVQSLLIDLGAITGRKQRAGELRRGMDSILVEVRARVGHRKRVKVAYILGGNPPWVAGPGTFIDELLGIAGGENVFSDLEALYGPVSPEEFLVRDIDLFLAPEGGEVLLPSTGIPLVRVSPEVELPGPELARTAWQLAKILHPQVFR
jgi:iron complex transport system substrate-binding protein